jgi:hypothetical protein
MDYSMVALLVAAYAMYRSFESIDMQGLSTAQSEVDKCEADNLNFVNGVIFAPLGRLLDVQSWRMEYVLYVF